MPDARARALSSSHTTIELRSLRSFDAKRRAPRVNEIHRHRRSNRRGIDSIPRAWDARSAIAVEKIKNYALVFPPAGRKSKNFSTFRRMRIESRDSIRTSN
jgi:hypothetical protein